MQTRNTKFFIGLHAFLPDMSQVRQRFGMTDSGTFLYAIPISTSGSMIKVERDCEKMKTMHINRISEWLI